MRSNNGVPMFRKSIPVRDIAARRRTRLIGWKIAYTRRRGEQVWRRSTDSLLPLHLDSGLASIRRPAKYSPGLAMRVRKIEGRKRGGENLAGQLGTSRGLSNAFQNKKLYNVALVECFVNCRTRGSTSIASWQLADCPYYPHTTMAGTPQRSVRVPLHSGLVRA